MIRGRGLEWFLIIGLMAGLATVCSGQSAAKGTQKTNQVTTDDYALTARLLDQEEVSRQFVSDVSREYRVVEVTLDPTARAIDVRRGDFHLSVADNADRIGPEEPASVAAHLQKTAPAYRDVTVSPEVGVTYRAGSRRPDPTLDPNTYPYAPPRGLTTRTGVDVRFGDKTGGLTDEDRKVTETELSDKGLPEGETSRPIVGHLYFRVDHPEKISQASLDYSPLSRSAATVQLRGE